MSYTPTTWATGDTITAQKMNKIEQGIMSAGGGFAVIAVECDEGINSTPFDIMICAEETHANSTHLVPKSSIFDGYSVGGITTFAYAPVIYIPTGTVVCLLIESEFVYGLNVQAEGGLSQSVLTAQDWSGTSWSSLVSTAWVINGSGKLTISDN